jgi:uncharacterized protein YkwD
MEMITFRHIAAVLLLATGAAPALAEVQFVIEEPAASSVKSGIGQVSGWAVSDKEIVSVEAFIDGASLGQVPYGGGRLDVAAGFPHFPDAEHSGWAMKWNYGLHEVGEHQLTILFTEDDGTETSKDVLFSTTRFHSEFIGDPDAVRTENALISSPTRGRLMIEGAEIEGELVDLELAWDQATQQFLIDKVTYDGQQIQNQSPKANAGPNQSVEAGALVTVRGNGSDADGFIASVSWQQVSGPGVSLSGANQWTATFTAPAQAGDVRLRFTVVDDQGLSDGDDLFVEVTTPTPPPSNQAPTANAGANRSVEQGDSVTLAGSGSDADGTIVGWSWAQISGAAVSLSGANTQTVQFTAPNSAGDIRLRLTVTDDDGATDTDDIIITVEASADPGNTTGSTLQSMLDDINAARGQEQDCGGSTYPSAPPLQWSSSLADVAKQHSLDMAQHGYFSHTSLDGTSMGSRVFPYWNGSRVGENIAASSGDKSDSAVVGLWLNSPGHCALLMDPDFSHVGVGKGHDPDNGYSYKYFWTMDLGG